MYVGLVSGDPFFVFVWLYKVTNTAVATDVNY